MTTFDIDWVRSQFPALKMKVNGYPAAFFDGPGGTQVPQRVIDAISAYLEFRERQHARGVCHQPTQ